jgi:hypothetical protein
MKDGKCVDYCKVNNICNDEHCHHDCKNEILCCEAKACKCAAELFCTVAERLSCEIKMARSSRELACLIELSNSFLIASAQKENALSSVLCCLGVNEEQMLKCP